MTKYEWERELRKNINSLPSDEIDMILDYYDELFEDKAESGLRESEIINEFGNPFDVARRIVNDYEYIGAAKTGSEPDDDPDDDRPPFVKRITGGVRRTVTRFTDSVKRSFKKDTPKDEERGESRDAYSDDCSSERRNAYRGSERYDNPEHNERGDRSDERHRRFQERYGRGGDNARCEDSRNRSDRRYDERDDRYGNRQNGAAPYYDREERGRNRDAIYGDGDKRGRYDSSQRTAAVTVKPQKKSRWPKVLLIILLSIPIFALLITLFTVSVSLFASGVGCIAGGIGQAVIGLLELPVSRAVALTKVGLGGVMFAAGVFLTVFSVWFIKKSVRICRAIFGRRKVKCVVEER